VNNPQNKVTYIRRKRMDQSRFYGQHDKVEIHELGTILKEGERKKKGEQGKTKE